MNQNKKNGIPGKTQAISGDCEIYPKLSIKATKLMVHFLNDPNLSRAAQKSGVAYKTAQQWMYGQNPTDKTFQDYLKRERSRIKESVQDMLLPLASNYYNMLLAHSLFKKHNNKYVSAGDARIAIMYLAQSKYLETNPANEMDQEVIDGLIGEIIDRNAIKHGLM